MSASARSGDTVYLSPGVYSSPLALRSGVGLDGGGAMFDIAIDTDYALALEGSNVLQNIHVRASGAVRTGVRVIRGPVTMKNVHIRGFRRFGVRAGSGEGTFVDGSVERCGEDGLSAAGSKWTVRTSHFSRNGDDGIDLFRAHSSLIVSNVFDGNSDAAVELAHSRDVRAIGNTSRGHRVTCAARIGDLPSRFTHNQLADRAFLEKRGDTPITEFAGLARMTDASNTAWTGPATETPTAIPVDIQVVQPATPMTAGSSPVAHAAGPTAASRGAERLRTSVASHLPYAGLRMSDLPMRNMLGQDTFLSAVLRKSFDDPLSSVDWMAARSSDGDSSLTERFRSYSQDLGISDILSTPAPALSSASPKVFADDILKAWTDVDAVYRRSFAAFDSAAYRALLDDLMAQYAEEPELGLPLVEDFEFDLEADRWQRLLMRRAAQVDMASLFSSCEKMMLFMQTVPASLQQLKARLPAKQAAQAVVYQARTPWGPLVISGTGSDRHDSVAGFLFDLGGDDQYHVLGGEAVSVIVDLSGDDRYTGEVASAVGRLAAVFDSAGADVYRTTSRTQGAGLLGCGLLIDAAGDDVYQAGRYSQGFGFFGAGWLRDLGGDDVYRAPGYSQGFGAVRGLGVLDDAAGNDRYEILPVNNDPIRDSSRTTSMGQGIGEGLRPNGCGGLGILWDGAGRDEYLADLFAQGIGYWYGFGALIDVGAGNDNYTAYHYVQGAGIHLSVGALYDGGGSDRYQAWYVAQGCGHDQSIGALLDIDGNDIYSSFGLSQGAGSTNGIGILCDVTGRDAYMGVARMSGQGDAWYQARLREYGSIGMFFDLGGDDYYASGSLNRAIWLKGEYGLGVDE